MSSCDFFTGCSPTLAHPNGSDNHINKLTGHEYVTIHNKHQHQQSRGTHNGYTQQDYYDR